MFPSPKSSLYEAIVLHEVCALDAEPSKFTVNGAEPDVGFALRAAVGPPVAQAMLPTRV
jgi:hypothetical protein